MEISVKFTPSQNKDRIEVRTDLYRVGPFYFSCEKNSDIVKHNFRFAVDGLNFISYNRLPIQVKKEIHLFLYSFFRTLSEIQIELKKFDSYFDFFSKKFSELCNYFDAINDDDEYSNFIAVKICEKMTESILDIIGTKED